MRASRSFAVAVVCALGFVGISCSRLQAQPAATTGPALGKPCNLERDVMTVGGATVVIPFLTQKLDVPVDDETKKRLLNSGLPCQDNVNADGDKKLSPAGQPATRFRFLLLADLHRPEFPSRRNVDRKCKAWSKLKTHWQHGTYFKPLLDVMLEPKDQPPVWSKRIIPEACQANSTTSPRRKKTTSSSSR